MEIRDNTNLPIQPSADQSNRPSIGLSNEGLANNLPEGKTSSDPQWLRGTIAFADRHTELLVFIVFWVAIVIWSSFIPRPWRGYGPDDSTNGGRPESAVWRQYAQDFGHFRWGVDLNLYLYSSLRLIAIALSAITPALIVAPSLKDKKVLAALPAVVVAIATGLIAEFDFKAEAARFDAAQVQLETEKSLYLTHAKPFYSIFNEGILQRSASNQEQPVKTRSSQTGSGRSVSALTLQADVTDIPFQHPLSNEETLANFAYRIGKIRQAVATERDQFLRGKSEPSASVPENRATTPDRDGDPSHPR
jgi:Protein of unknown function (DUF4231)